MTENEKNKVQGSQTWYEASVKRFVGEIYRVVEFMKLAREGILVMTRMPALLKTLEGPRAKPMEEVETKAQSAKRESEAEFPYLHSQGVVVIWSLLEAFVQDVLVGVLAHDDEASKVEAIARLKVTLGEVLSLGAEDRAEFILSLLERESAAGLRKGIDRFESLLKPLNLGGPVPDGLRRDIFEFAQIRNAIVHAGGRIDKRLCEACPWLGFEVGSGLTVSAASFTKYGEASINYALLINARVALRYGVVMEDDGVGEVFERYGEKR